jgi:hypothetical protein
MKGLYSGAIVPQPVEWRSLDGLEEIPLQRSSRTMSERLLTPSSRLVSLGKSISSVAESPWPHVAATA